MRALLFSFSGIGFLLLIAISWHAADDARNTAVAAMIPPAATAREPASTAAASRESIQRLTACLENSACPTPHSQAAEALALAFGQHAASFGADPELARAALETASPKVQAVGLRMLAALPPSAASLSALGNGLRRSVDPALAEGAVRELQRYLGTVYEADAQRIVEHLVGYGDRSPAQRAAALARPFINEHSYEEFHELLGRLDAGAEAARFLRAALDEYEKRH